MSTDPGRRGAALVIGAGDATGGAIARRFAKGGLIACATRRSADKLVPLVDEIGVVRLQLSSNVKHAT